MKPKSVVLYFHADPPVSQQHDYTVVWADCKNGFACACYVRGEASNLDSGEALDKAKPRPFEVVLNSVDLS